MRMIVLLFWITCNLCSGHLMLLTTSHGKETPDDIPGSFHVAQNYRTGAVVHAGDMEMFSVAYVSSSIARQVLCDVNCDACKTCLASRIPVNQCLHIFQGVQWYSTVPHLSLEAGGDCWHFHNSNEFYDGRSGSIEFSGTPYYSCHWEEHWLWMSLVYWLVSCLHLCKLCHSVKR
jgi:hypothetical protein